MAIQGLTGYEHGVVSTNGAGLFQNILGGTRVSIQDTTIRSGSYALRCNADTTSGSGARTTTFATSNVVVSRFAFLLPSLPPERLIIWETATSGTNFVALVVTASGVLQVVRSDYSTVIVTGPTLSTNTWYVVDIRVNSSANPWVIDWRVNGSQQTQGTWSVAAETAFTGVWLESWSAINSTNGNLSSGTATVYFDDHSWATDSGDYPLTVDKILAMSPTGMGTHSGANNFQDDDNTAVDATSYQRVDDVPFPSGTTAGDYIKQVTASGTSYIELTNGPAPQAGNPVAVRALLAYMSAGTAANNGQTRVRRSDDTETTVYSGGMNVTSHNYKGAMVSAPTGGWTQTQLEALRWRIGFSTDVSPVPFWTALMLEVGYPATDVLLAASLAGLATVSGNIKEILTIKASSSGIATISGNLKRILRLSSVSSGIGTVSATLKKLIVLTGSVAGTGVISASLQKFLGLSSVTSGIATVSGTLKKIIGLKATSTGVSTLSSNVVLLITLKALSNGLSTTQAGLSLIVKLLGSISGSGSVSANLKKLISLASASSGISTLTANLNTAADKLLQGVVNGLATITANLKQQISLKSTVSGISILTSSLSLVESLKGIANGLASITATLTTVITDIGLRLRTLVKVGE